MSQAVVSDATIESIEHIPFDEPFIAGTWIGEDKYPMTEILPWAKKEESWDDVPFMSQLALPSESQLNGQMEGISLSQSNKINEAEKDEIRKEITRLEKIVARIHSKLLSCSNTSLLEFGIRENEQKIREIDDDTIQELEDENNLLKNWLKSRKEHIASLMDEMHTKQAKITELRKSL